MWDEMLGISLHMKYFMRFKKDIFHLDNFHRAMEL